MLYTDIDNLAPGDLVDVIDAKGRVHREIIQDVDDMYITTIGSIRDSNIEGVALRRYPKWQIYEFIEKVRMYDEQ